MKIVCISDTHNQLHKMEIPEGDILIHAGDATGRGTDFEIENFGAELAKLPHKHKVFVPGNHDIDFERRPEIAKLHLPEDVHVLIDKPVEIEGIKIYGSPWQPEFHNWAFNVPRGAEIAKKWNKIPAGLDILVTHGPPHSILDVARAGGDFLGCEELYNAVFEKRPRFHVFGHIHGGYGRVQVSGITFVNAASCNEAYVPVNPPQVIGINKGK